LGEKTLEAVARTMGELADPRMIVSFTLKNEAPDMLLFNFLQEFISY
jgi:hypothetical protein